jgi:hypothetical protein
VVRVKTGKAVPCRADASVLFSSDSTKPTISIPNRARTKAEPSCAVETPDLDVHIEEYLGVAALEAGSSPHGPEPPLPARVVPVAVAEWAEVLGTASKASTE